MEVLELNESNFNDTLSGDKTVIIDFWAPWCGPCRQFAPTFEAAAAKHEDVVFAKVNTDEEMDLARKYNIEVLPTFAIIKNGEIVEKFNGFKPKTFIQQILDKHS